jgi:hypothetical protein
MTRDDRSEELMPDVQAIPRFSAPPAAPITVHDDGGDIGRGMVNAVLLSVPLWALIGFAISAVF